MIVRHLVNDDAEQAEAARALLEGLTADRQGFSCREVAIEVVRALARFYQCTRARIADVLVELIATDSLVIKAADDIARAAIVYREGGVGFANLIILLAATRSGALPLYTFDRKLPRMEVFLMESAEP